MTGSRITFAKATRHHSGIYNCSADNGYSPMPPGAQKQITLDVQRKFTDQCPRIICPYMMACMCLRFTIFYVESVDKPTIEVEETFIHTLKDDDTTEIVCIVHASPSATVTWMKNGKTLSEKERFVSLTT